jgi:hypothetical protein
LNTTLASAIQKALGDPFHFQAGKVRYRAQAKTEIFELSAPRLILGFRGDIKAKGRADECARNWDLPATRRPIELPIASSNERDALARLVMSDQWMEWMLATLAKTGIFCEKLNIGSGVSALALEWFPRSAPVLTHGVLPYTHITLDYTANDRLGAARATAPQITQMAEIKIEPGVLAAYKIVIPMKLKAAHGMTGRQARGRLDFHALLRIETDPTTGALRAQIGQAFVKEVDLALEGVDPASLENALNEQLSKDYSTTLLTTRKPRLCARPEDGELALSLQGEMTRSVWKGCSGSGACFLDLGLKTEIGPRKLFWSDVIYRVESGYSEQFFEVDDPQGWKLSGCEQTRMTGPRQLDLVRDSQRAQQIQDQILQSSVLTGVREMDESQASINTLHDQLRGLIEGRYGPIIIQQDPETLRNGFLNHPQYQQWRTLVPIRQVHRVRPAVRPQQNLNRPLIRPH